jgi:hypothetical protein
MCLVDRHRFCPEQGDAFFSFLTALVVVAGLVDAIRKRPKGKDVAPTGIKPRKLAKKRWVPVAHMSNSGGMFAGDNDDLRATESYGTFDENPSPETSRPSFNSFQIRSSLSPVMAYSSPFTTTRSFVPQSEPTLI